TPRRPQRLQGSARGGRHATPARQGPVAIAGQGPVARELPLPRAALRHLPFSFSARRGSSKGLPVRKKKAGPLLREWTGFAHGNAECLSGRCNSAAAYQPLPLAPSPERRGG